MNNPESKPHRTIRQFQDRLRAANYEEIINSEALFMADLAEILTPDALENGVLLDFGESRDHFTATVETLELESLLKNNQLEIVQSRLGEGGSSQQFISSGRVDRVVQEMGLVQTLDYIQSEGWGVADRNGYKHFESRSPRHAAASQITLGQTHEGSDGERYIAKDMPCIALEMWVQYEPNAEDEYGEGRGDLAYDVARLQKQDTFQARVFERLAEYHHDSERELTLPQQRYSIALSGTAAAAGFDLFASITPKVLSVYRLRGGRLVEVTETEQND